MKKRKALLMPRLHRAMLKKLASQPFVMATTATLPYLEHLPPSTVIRAHKIINADMGPSFHRHKADRPKYHPGTTVEEPGCNTNPKLPCAAGLHVGTGEWMKFCYTNDVHAVRHSDLLAVVEFTRADVGAFPTGHSDNRGDVLHGKFRVRRLKVRSVSMIEHDEYNSTSIGAKNYKRSLVVQRLVSTFTPRKRKGDVR